MGGKIKISGIQPMKDSDLQRTFFINNGEANVRNDMKLENLVES